jgi:predicted membrane-bound spermidine synthase
MLEMMTNKTALHIDVRSVCEYDTRLQIMLHEAFNLLRDAIWMHDVVGGEVDDEFSLRAFERAIKGAAVAFVLSR